MLYSEFHFANICLSNCRTRTGCGSFFVPKIHPQERNRMKNRTRKYPLQVYLNEEENYILEEKLHISGMKDKSSFIRKLILYGFVYDVDYSHIRQMNALLGNIGGNINQIAKRINTTNHVYQQDMDEIKELMNQIWQLQKSMVSNQPLIKQ